MTDPASETSIVGVAITDNHHGIISSVGLAEDPRIEAMITDPGWMSESLSRHVVPIMFSERQLVASVNGFSGGSLIVLSEGASDVVLDFLLSVPFAYAIIDHILSDPYDAMAIVDAREKLAFISPIHEKFFGLRSGEGIGKHVRDVIENTRLHHVVRTGIAEVGQIHKMKGSERVVSRHPIRQNGKVVGAIGRIMFKGPQQLEAMSRRIRDLESEIAVYKKESKEKIQGEEFLDAIIGQSVAIQSVRSQIRKIAPLDIPVLIQGESGTGKELVAQALHMLSPRQSGRLVTVNAAALPETLVESELFGYEAGSFTGADRKGRPGKFELADKGTIFLDEIGDMPLETQTKLLRVLQDRMVERVGGEKAKRVDFRLCSATNRDLEAFVEQGRFRLDLFYRISPVVISLPSLEERLEDIPLLLNHFASELARQYGRPLPEIDLDLHGYLMDQSWPGNIRQLRHMVERAFVFADDGRLSVADFEKLSSSPATQRKQAEQPSTASGSAVTLKESLDSLENKLINDAIIRFKGNKKKAAEYLGVSRSYLYKKLEALE